MTSSDSNDGLRVRIGPAQARARRMLRAAFAEWGLAGGDEDVRLEFSPRMTVSLGRCYPDRRLIRLHEGLRRSDVEEVLREVVYHEAAHIVAFEKHGRGIRPHGPEWVRLMRAVGIPARTRIACDIELGSLPDRDRGRRLTYEHRCPVCQTVRHAERPVRQWRCAACVEVGLSGELRITSRPSGSSAAQRKAPPDEGAAET